MMTSREVIHLSLGDKACQISAHWLDLEGLAGTSSTTSSSNGDDDALVCDISITHTLYQNQYVPRVLMVDTSTAAASASLPQSQIHVSNNEAALEQQHNFPTWSGRVERLEQQRPQHAAASAASQSQQQQDPYLANNNFLQTASVLRNSPYSRYRVLPTSRNEPATAAFATDSGGRHVVWDDDEDEEEDEQQALERERRQYRQRQQWYQSHQPRLQAQLDDFWVTDATCLSASQRPNDQHNNEKTTTRTMSWKDYWMASSPHHPRSFLTLPFVSGNGDTSSSSSVVSDWDNYRAGVSDNTDSILAQWKQDSLLERVRLLLEDCDSCQGAILTTDCGGRHGLFAGLTTWLLQELADECPSARRWVLSVSSSEEEQQQQASSWQVRQTQFVRQSVQRGLACHDYAVLADAVLPLYLPSSSAAANTATTAATATLGSTSHAAAYTAAALECMTLCYRLNGHINNKKHPSLIGLNSYYYGSYSGEVPFGTAAKLSFGEFLSCLKPSIKQSVLELDAFLPQTTSSKNEDQVWNQIQAGTSMERDRRRRQGGPSLSGVHQPRDVLPGEWMLDPKAGGILSSLSFREPVDRSLQQHFALSTAVRFGRTVSATMSVTQYVTALMEGMGVRYRPEQSVACVLNQSLGNLVEDGYAAGSYWKAVWPPSMPVVATLGNTTRVYPYLNETAIDMKKALSPQYRGFYSRDVMNGVLPEPEDCQEALSYCFDLRDVYRPPESSGLAVDEEGDYFDV